MSEIQTKLMEIRRGLQQSRTLSDIWRESSFLRQELGWQQPQLRLWLAVLPGIEVTQSESENPSYRIASEQHGGDALAEAIYEALRKAGRPMPIAQLKSQLPPTLAATEPRIKAAVKSHSKLMVMGPVIKLVTN